MRDVSYVHKIGFGWKGKGRAIAQLRGVESACLEGLCAGQGWRSWWWSGATEFACGHFELNTLIEHTHGEVQEELEIRVWSYGGKSQLGSTVLRVILTKRIVEDTKGNEILESRGRRWGMMTQNACGDSLCLGLSEGAEAAEGSWLDSCGCSV